MKTPLLTPIGRNCAQQARHSVLSIEPAIRKGHSVIGRMELLKPPLILEWDLLHDQSRQELCHGACVNESLASQPWKRIALWLRVLLADSLKARSKGRCELKP